MTSTIQRLSESYDYSSFDPVRHAAHHRALIQAIEPARWTMPRQGPGTLSDEEVLAIRIRYAAGGVTQQELASEYGLEPQTISQITTGETYSNVGGPRTDGRRYLRGEQARSSILNDDAVREIRRLAKTTNFTQRYIAYLYGVNYRTVGAVIRRDTWKHVSDE